MDCPSRREPARRPASTATLAAVTRIARGRAPAPTAGAAENGPGRRSADAARRWLRSPKRSPIRPTLVESGLVWSDIPDVVVHTRPFLIAPRLVGPRHDRPHAAGPAAPVRARDAGRGAVREGRVAEPGRIGERPGRRAHDSRRRSHWRAHPGSHDPRRDVRQHRHRLRHGRRGARLQREAVPAGKREPRAQAHPARARRRAAC